MIRQADPQDVPEMERFLAGYAETSMFLRGNLAAHGTQEHTHPYGTTFFLSKTEGRINAVGGVTNGGYLMCQSAGVASAFFTAFAQALNGRHLIGMTGAPDDVTAVFDALGCQDAAFTLRRTEPLYVRDLAALAAPQQPHLSLRAPRKEDLELLAQWFAGYHRDTGLAPLKAAAARQVAQDFIGSHDGRVLLSRGQPVAMSAFNARANETVQIGGVYVPDPLRGQGLGGAVVAEHLLEARQDGITKAILFAASRYAARAYEAIGFRHIGAYELALFAEPWQVDL